MPALLGGAGPAIEPTAGVAGESIPLRRMWQAAIVLLGVSASAVGWTIWQLRNDAIQAAITESGNIATVLAGQLSRSLRGIDGVLMDVQRSSKYSDVNTRADFRAAFDRREFRDMLVAHLAHLQYAFNIAVADETGQIVVTTAAWPTPRINVGDRDYFQDARTRTDGLLSTSSPIFNRIDGKRTLVFARRLENASGKLIGIIYVGVNTKYFEDIYGSIQSVHSHQFRLRKADGAVLVRHPDGTGEATRRLGLWHDAVARGGGGYSSAEGANGTTHFVSVRPVPEYPLVVDVAVNEGAALAGWRQRSAAILLGTAAFLLCSLYLLMAVTRQVRRLSSSESSLAQASRQLDAALNNMSQGLCMFDRELRLIVCNRQFGEIYRLRPEQTQFGTSLQAIFQACSEVGTAPDGESVLTEERLELILRRSSYCTTVKLADGRTVSISHQSMSDGGWVSVHQDITEQKRVEAELARMARYDLLTGLANRALFMEHVDAALARMRELDEEFAILMLDLDRFKTVNDSLGHPVGDTLLQAVAQRLRHMLSDVDKVARLGGDEFALLQPIGKNQKDIAITLADRILDTITEPYELDGRRFTIGTSIGITFAPHDAVDAHSLFKNADLALYKAKSQGGNRYCLFAPAMEAQARDRRELEDDMRKAILRNEFELHYQTIVDVRRQKGCGAEALVRWRHPERGLIFPDQFIAIAEESGLIGSLGEWILRRACTDAAAWPSHLRLAVNLSPAQFKQGDVLRIVQSALADCGLAPTRLELEITETLLLEKNQEVLEILHEMKELGVSIVLDDFGVGYSSMKYLQMFPFDKIKIDKSFIQSMTGHADSAAIVCAIAGLGRNLDIETTAEGVETTEQLALLRGAGCQLAQGYLFSRPVPTPELSFERPEAFGLSAKPDLKLLKAL